MLDRIIKIMEYYKLTPSEFADTLEIDRSRLSHILNGRNKPSLEVVMKILENFPDISSEWLLFDKGDMFKKKIFSKDQLQTGELDLIIPEKTKQKIKDDKIIDDLSINEQTKETVPPSTTEQTESPIADIQEDDISKAEMKPIRQKDIISIVWFFSDGTYKYFYPES
ncbi:MAG: helix-turn-helix transcriptional regulator [Bacteroidales bacterium]|jgi:transcriptional regulator with XRE-family HTH domain|nr:helix-turn-helix transcriptional regulator [Bacteroidales bacterium]MDI9576235.1 helix-turn-helix transcriptional regulator [Bacteroidota bacterium]MDD3755225.1 helix-turn-helix transcriptional regulator [Bacteroidales bacterium]MDY0400352.1 helix-turn-helix transcriptional regulator [Bacteroidales bacterium]HHW58671.1 helix-turn-helix transcriptional regulator [Bacteroidales bacterium]